MKTISINKEVRNMIAEVREDKESVNSTIKRLLSDVDRPSPHHGNKTKTTIHLEEDVLEHLQSLKIHPTKSYNSIITRLLNSQKCNSDD